MRASLQQMTSVVDRAMKELHDSSSESEKSTVNTILSGYECVVKKIEEREKETQLKWAKWPNILRKIWVMIFGREKALGQANAKIAEFRKDCSDTAQIINTPKRANNLQEQSPLRRELSNKRSTVVESEFEKLKIKYCYDIALFEQEFSVKNLNEALSLKERLHGKCIIEIEEEDGNYQIISGEFGGGEFIKGEWISGSIILMGCFKDWELDGEGFIRYDNDRFDVGKFEKSSLVQGTMKYSDHEETGTFRNGRLNGRGKITYYNEDLMEIEGDFIDGKSMRNAKKQLLSY